MRPKKSARNVAVWIGLIGLFCCSRPATAQFASHIDCIFPVSWDGRAVKLVVKPLEGTLLLDTATVIDRRAVFNVNLAEPAAAYIWVEGNKDDINFLIDSSQLTIAVDPQKTPQVLISGSPSSDLWRRQSDVLSQLSEASSDKRSAFFESNKPKDAMATANYERIADSLETAYNTTLISMIDENPLAIASWHRFAMHASGLPYTATLRLFNKLTSFHTYPSYKKLAADLFQKRLGSKATDFTLPTLPAGSITLSKLASTFILLDFSSTLMASCRQRHQALKNIYATYHPLGLEIITISSELDQPSGQLALQQEHLPWVVTVEPAMSPNVGKAYKIVRWPDNVLLDAHKTVVGRDMSPQALAEMLEGQLRKKSD